MDNAAKALIMAGAVLVTVMLISLAMYMLATFRDFMDKSSIQAYSTQAEAFNRFFVYSEPSVGEQITGDQVYNLVGKAADINNSEAPMGYIKITFAGTEIENAEYFKNTYHNEGDFKNFIKSKYAYTYKITENGLVTEISFTKVG